MPRRAPLLLCLVLAAAGQPSAGEVYRCAVDGKTVYSDRPCDSKSVVVPIQSPPSAAAPAPRDLAKENAEADARIRQKIDADAAERKAYRVEQDRFARQCQRYRDEILRQQAWLNATSAAVRQAAAAEIAIQRGNLTRDGCAPPR